jgi:hypothetical protein
VTNGATDKSAQEREESDEKISDAKQLNDVGQEIVEYQPRTLARYESGSEDTSLDTSDESSSRHHRKRKKKSHKRDRKKRKRKRSSSPSIEEERRQRKKKKDKKRKR